jgi:DNA-directed RNA polymerase beta' subunit
MAHKVKVFPGSSFRLNIACTPPYNADFDGDEMNMLPAQSVITSQEMEQFMSVGKNITNDNRVWVSLQQHSSASAYLLSLDPGVEPGRCAVLLAEFPQVTLPRKPISGKELISLILPDDFCVNKEELKINNGKYISGVLNQHVLNEVLLRYYLLLYGSDRTVKFMSSFQRMLEAYIRLRGLTMSVGDCKPLTDTHQNLCDDVVLAIHSMCESTGHTPGDCSSLAREREKSICETLDILRDIVGKEQTVRMSSSNSLRQMVDSGSKGNQVNIIQNTAMIGQQYDHRCGRMKPRVGADPFSAEECAFIRNSFYTGMSAIEYFNHLRSARVGLVDTVVKTSETGYSARKLCKLLESIIVRKAN